MAESDSDSSLGELSENEEGFQEHLSALKAKWKAALKRNKKLLLKCPNNKKCQYKCSSVGGMQYHYERCTGNAPRFKCRQCNRQYESRTGLNYHMTSFHTNEPTEENQSDCSSRPQRSAALNTMSAIHIANNLPPLKQPPLRTTPMAHKHTNKNSSRDAPPTDHIPPKKNKVRLVPKSLPKQKSSPPVIDFMEQPQDSPSTETSPTPTTPISKLSSMKVEGVVRGKKGAKYVTIPSIEYPDEYKSYLPAWRQEMKDNKIIKCPNYKECDFKCTTVNGMKYHFVRCKKANPPEFNCELCGKKFQCRTGLVWHLKKTHKLIDIQPSKGGGFKGTIPSKLTSQGHLQGMADTSEDMPRKKFKLGDNGKGGVDSRQPSTPKSQSHYNGDELFGTRRRRKHYTPQRTPEEILQNVMLFKCLPLPKLSPQSIKVCVPLSEYSIYNDIPTDKAHYPSAVILLGEEALSWQRMSSDSDSDGEYQMDRDYEDPFGFGGYKSNNSVSDSDEDFMCSLTKKKGKTNSSTVVTSSSRIGGAKRGRGLKKEAKELQAELPPVESVNPSSTNCDPFPPPLLSTKDRVNKNNVLIDIPAVPALIKVSPDRKLSTDYFTSQGETEDGYITNKYSSNVTHVQPPPDLIMPAKVKSDNSTSIHSRNSKLPHPPPLLRNSYSLDPPTSTGLSDNHHHPHIVLPSDISLSSHPLKQATDSVDWTGSLSLSTSHHSSLDQPSPPPFSLTASPKRPGKSPKSRTTGSQQQGKKLTTLRLGPTTAHFKPSKSTKGHTSSYSTKGMKMTRYEFQPTLSSDGGDVQMQPVTTTHHLIHNPTHTQPTILSPSGSNIPNLVSPVQIVQRVSGSPQQVQSYQAIQPSSVLLMQGAHPFGVEYSPKQQISPSYITQDGQTYQIVQTQSQHYSSSDPNDSSQKVSVIMQPGVSSSGGFIETTGVGGVQYITQLDGPPDKLKKKGNSGTKDNLKETFEKSRREEQAKLLELKTGSKTVDSKSHIPSSKAQNLTEAPSSRSNAGAKTTSESLMSEQLKIYFKREVARKTKPSSSPVSDSSSQSRVGVDKLKQKSHTRRQRSSPSTSSETVPVMVEKFHKPPRLVISPNVFLSSVPPLLSLSSMSGVKSGSVVSSGQPSASKGKSGKDVKRKHSSPDLSNLFQPDNLTSRNAFKSSQSSMDVNTELPNCLSQVANESIGLESRPVGDPNSVSPHAEDVENVYGGAVDELGASASRLHISLHPVSCNSNNSNSNDMTSSTTNSLNSSTSEVDREGASEGDKEGESRTAVDKQDISTKSKVGKRQPQSSEQGEKSEEVVSPSPSPAPKRKRGRPPGKSNKVKKTEPVSSQGHIKCSSMEPLTSSKESVVREQDDSLSSRYASTSTSSEKTVEVGDSCSEVAPNSTAEDPKRIRLGKRSANFRQQSDQESPVHCPVMEQDERFNLEGDKQVDGESSNKTTSGTPLKRKRGRPKKNASDSLSKGPVADIPVADIIPVAFSNTNSTFNLSDTPQTPPVKKKRGRPRKILDSTSTGAVLGTPIPVPDIPIPVGSNLNTDSSPCLSDTPQTPPVKKKRGHPRKILDSTSTGAVLGAPIPVPDIPILVGSNLNTDSSPCLSDTLQTPPVKKKRGRPRKIQDSTSIVSPSTSVKSDSNNSVLELKADQQTKAKRRPKKERSFECEKCGTVYTTKLGLKYHMDSVHPPDILPDTPLKDCLQVWRAIIKKTKSVLCAKCKSHRANSIPAMEYHWQRCGENEESFSVTCPHCGKVYKSKAGLVYHVGVVHTPKPILEERTPSPDPDLLDPSQPVPSRKAAAQATKKLSQLASMSSSSTYISFKDASLNQSCVSNEGNAALADQHKMSLFKQQLADTGSGICPLQMCERKFTTLSGLRYHLINHSGPGPKQKFNCPVCYVALHGAKRFENHLKKKHPDDDVDIQAVADNEYVPKEDVEDSDIELPDDWGAEKEEVESENEPEEPLKQSKGSKKSMTSKQFTRSSLVWVHGEPRGYRHYRDKVKQIRRLLYSDKDQPPLSGEKWQVNFEHWKKVEESDFHSYFPEVSQSVPFTVQSQKTEEGSSVDHTLSLFSARVLDSDLRGAVFFAGGPVWSMDWLPVSGDSQDHYIALCAYRGVDETFQMKTPFSQCGFIQLWRVGTLTNKSTSLNEQEHSPTVQISMGVAHSYGVIRDMKWCPSVCCETEGNRLGVLAVACSDGALRILVMPMADMLAQHFSKKKVESKKNNTSKGKLKASSSAVPLVVTPEKEAAILVPTGFGISDWSKFGQCLCLDWLPSKKYSRIAAGFSNGIVCVWDLELKLPWSTVPGSCEGGLIINPITQLLAHRAPCRTVSWCPHDNNYLFTGGYDRFGSLWDLRQPHTPLEKQEFLKGLFVDSVWPLVWCGVLTQHEVTVNAYSQMLVHQLPYLYSSPGNRMCRSALMCNAPLTSMSYCAWSDRVAATSFSGELCVKVFASHFHMASNSHQRKEYKLLYLCYREPMIVKVSPLSKSVEANPKYVHSTLNKKKKGTNSKESPPEDVDLCPQLLNISVSKPKTMKSLMESSRLVFCASPSSELTKKYNSLSPADTPLSAITKASWSPNECSYEWLMVGTNSGLVQLLHIPAPREKPKSSTFSQESLAPR